MKRCPCNLCTEYHRRLQLAGFQYPSELPYKTTPEELPKPYKLVLTHTTIHWIPIIYVDDIVILVSIIRNLLIDPSILELTN